MRVMGYDDAPHGHAEMIFDDVKVPIGKHIFSIYTLFDVLMYVLLINTLVFIYLCLLLLLLLLLC